MRFMPTSFLPASIRGILLSKFIDERHLPTNFWRKSIATSIRGSSGKVNLALDALPNFKAMPGPGAHLRGAISISPSVEYMERAYDDAKYGNFSRRPYIDMVIPTLTDPSVAPPGKHIMSCFVQYAPYKLRPGLNWDDQKEAFGNNVINTIAEYAPNIKDIILHKQVVTPLDLEREFGLSEGNIFQGELSLEQLFFLRPVPGWAQYPHSDQEPIHVRIGHASGRRHHGRPRPFGGAGNTERLQGSGLDPCPDRHAMSSSLAAGTTGWSPLSIWPRLDTSRWFSNAAPRPGGAAITEEFHPGFRCSTLAHSAGPLRPDVVSDMQLRKTRAED